MYCNTVITNVYIAIFYLDVNKLKKQRNKAITYAVGGIGLLTLPVTGAAALVFGPAAAIYTALAGVGVAAAAAAAIIYQIIFLVVSPVLF